jgi:hypothetical protein
MNDIVFHEQVFSVLKEGSPDLAEMYYKKFKKYFYEKKDYQLWPLKWDWWCDKKFDLIRKKYNFLEDILIAMVHKKIRLTQKDTVALISPYEEKIDDDIYNKYWITINDNNYYPALLKQGRKAWIAWRVGCSISTIENYLAALVRIQALRIYRLGKNGTYYSAGYWTKSPIEDGSWIPKVTPYLNMKLAESLLDPEQFYLRKKNK